MPRCQRTAATRSAASASSPYVRTSSPKTTAGLSGFFSRRLASQNPIPRLRMSLLRACGATVASGCRGSGVEAVEPSGDHRRLLGALDLDGLVDRELVPAADLGDLGDDGVHAHAGADLDGRDEADLVEAVVHPCRDARHIEQLGPE